MQHLNGRVHLSEGAGPCTAIREEALGKERARDARQMGSGFSPFGEVKCQAAQQEHEQERSHNKQGDFPALEGS